MAIDADRTDSIAIRSGMMTPEKEEGEYKRKLRPVVRNISNHQGNDDHHDDDVDASTDSGLSSDSETEGLDAQYDEYCNDLALVSSADTGMRRGGIAHIRAILQNNIVDIKDISSLPHLHNVLCKDRPDDSISICAWHAVKPTGCKPRPGRVCTFVHADRLAQQCPLGWQNSDACSYGAMCRFRHKDDTYTLWIAARGGKATKRLLKDLKSPWSIHNRRLRSDKAQNSKNDTKARDEKDKKGQSKHDNDHKSAKSSQ